MKKSKQKQYRSLKSHKRVVREPKWNTRYSRAFNVRPFISLWDAPTVVETDKAEPTVIVE